MVRVLSWTARGVGLSPTWQYSFLCVCFFLKNKISLILKKQNGFAPFHFFISGHFLAFPSQWYVSLFGFFHSSAISNSNICITHLFCIWFVVYIFGRSKPVPFSALLATAILFAWYLSLMDYLYSHCVWPIVVLSTSFHVVCWCLIPSFNVGTIFVLLCGWFLNCLIFSSNVSVLSVPG